MNPETKIARYKRFYTPDIQVVEIWPRLTPNLDGVLETRCSNKRSACSLALQKSVRSHGGAMQKNDVAFVFSEDSRDCVADGF